MMRLRYAVLGALAACLVGTGVATAAPGEGNDEGGQCRVVIDRSQAAGTFDVTRQRDSDNNCVCYAYTGPETQGQTTEEKVSRLQERKSCPDAKLMALPAAAGVGFLGGSAIPIIGLGVVAGGIAMAASSDSEEAPTSP